MSDKYTAAELQDRGNIKWTSMMLSEHREILFEMDRSQKDMEPQDHDLDRLCEIAQLLARAMHDSLVVWMKYWKNKRHEEVIGMVKSIDPRAKAVLILVDEDDKRWVEAVHIVDVEEWR